MNSHAPFQWKSGILKKKLLERSLLIYSNQYLLGKELDHLRTVFIKTKDYPAKTVDYVIKNELQRENVDIANEPKANNTDNKKTKIQLFLPFSGKQRVQLLSKMKKHLKLFPSNMKTYI